MGSVEVAATDFFRDALVGAAPLLVGGGFIAYAGLARMGLAPLGESLIHGRFHELAQGISTLPGQADFWVWFYLAFVTSSTMFPSEADRRGWVPMGVTILVAIGASLVCGAGPWMAADLMPWLNRGFQAITVVLAMSLAVQGIILAPLWLFRRLLSQLTGVQVG